MSLTSTARVVLHKIRATVWGECSGRPLTALCNVGNLHLSFTPSVSFYLSLDSAILHYPATNKKKQREYVCNG
jgi:hypothetical protein